MPAPSIRGLRGEGFPNLSTSVDNSAFAESVYAGYAFLPHVAVEAAYIHRDADIASVKGNIVSTAELDPLLSGTTGLIRGYGNIASLSVRGEFPLLPRLFLEPRVGGFYWGTSVSAEADGERDRITHQGGGATVGAGIAWRLWRRLSLGVNVDHYHGFPHNTATLYAGSLEMRF